MTVAHFAMHSNLSRFSAQPNIWTKIYFQVCWLVFTIIVLQKWYLRCQCKEYGILLSCKFHEKIFSLQIYIFSTVLCFCKNVGGDNHYSTTRVSPQFVNTQWSVSMVEMNQQEKWLWVEKVESFLLQWNFSKLIFSSGKCLPLCFYEWYSEIL